MTPCGSLVQIKHLCHFHCFQPRLIRSIVIICKGEFICVVRNALPRVYDIVRFGGWSEEERKTPAEILSGCK